MRPNRFAPDEAEFRRFLHDLAGRFTAIAASSFWIGEYDRNQAAAAPEFAVADAIIALHVNRTAERELRVLQVLKLRGSGFLTGEHAYRIGADGLNVFPRLADEIDTARYTLDSQRVSTGIPALDETLGDGYWPGAVTLIAGPTGAGKTLIGLHFLFHGAENGEPGVLATFPLSGRPPLTSRGQCRRAPIRSSRVGGEACAAGAEDASQ